MGIIKRIFLTLLLSGSLRAQIPDDVLHYYAGFIIGIVSGHVTFHYTTRERWDVSIGSAFASAAVAGYAKEEFYDGTLNKGTKSSVDLIATVHGGIGSIPVCCVSFNIHQRRKHPEIFEEDFEF